MCNRESNMDKWIMIKKLVRMCHECEGIIFGGTARDSYIHYHDARKFYQKYDESRYSDTQITEFLGRFVVPEDVDCMMLAKDHEILLSQLQKKFHIRTMLEVDANYLADAVDAVTVGDYLFKRYSIVDLKKDGIPVVVQLDVIVQVNGDSFIGPFKHVDMDVNALWWKNDSLTINPHAVHSIGRLHGASPILVYTIVFENILNKVATCISDCPPRRILKMKKKGWEIKYTYQKIHISDAPYDGVCVLCQDTIKGDHSTFECKCAHICMECLRKHYAAIPRCTICKMPVNEDELMKDVLMYNAIQFNQDSPNYASLHLMP